MAQLTDPAIVAAFKRAGVDQDKAEANFRGNWKMDALHKAGMGLGTAFEHPSSPYRSVVVGCAPEMRKYPVLVYRMGRIQKNSVQWILNAQVQQEVNKAVDTLQAEAQAAANPDRELTADELRAALEANGWGVFTAPKEYKKTENVLNDLCIASRNFLEMIERSV